MKTSESSENRLNKFGPVVGSSFSDLGSVLSWLSFRQVWDDFQEGRPFSTYSVGQMLTAKVLAKVRVPRIKAGSGYFHLELSIRPSELAGV